MYLRSLIECSMMSSRFISSNVEAEKERLLTNITSKNTKKHDKHALSLLTEFVSKVQNTSLDYVIKETKLDDTLEMFYASVRKADGTKMKINSLNAIRFSLNRVFRESHNINLADEINYLKSAKIFHGVVKDLKKEGLVYVRYYDQISEPDIKAIINGLDPNVPQQILWLIFFFIQLYFCRRGRENLESFDKDTFAIGEDSNKREFVYQKKDELTKNHREGDHEKASGGRMYANKELGMKCPVAIFKLYMSKLSPANPRLWQYPKASFYKSDNTWFTNRPIGINSLQNFMQSISKFCSLSKIYSNHCIRVTGISVLGEKFTENEIKSISGHKSNSSLGIYKRSSDEKRGNMSDHISKTLCPNLPSTSIDSTQNTAALTLQMENDDLDDDQELTQWMETEETRYFEAKSHSAHFIFNNCSNIKIIYSTPK